MRFLLFILLACLCSSCATLVNDKHKTVKIFTNKPTSVVYQNDTSLTFESRNSFKSTSYAKNSYSFNLSFPYFNNLRVAYEKDKKTANFGFQGLSLGFEYYIKNDASLLLALSKVMDYKGFIGVDGAYYGGKRVFSTSYLALTYNHKLKRFSLGYGLIYGKNNLNQIEDIDRDIPEINKSYSIFGVMTNAYYRVSNKLNIGLIYRPTFYRLNIEKALEYEHLISLDFNFKFQFNEVKF